MVSFRFERLEHPQDFTWEIFVNISAHASNGFDMYRQGWPETKRLGTEATLRGEDRGE
jgi:hypothetical protein